MPVSIHASVKDATCSKTPVILTFKVSIHASVKDATKKTYNRFITNDVSIHASVKDATDIINLSIHSHKFQSTHL